MITIKNHPAGRWPPVVFQGRVFGVAVRTGDGVEEQDGEVAVVFGWGRQAEGFEFGPRVFRNPVRRPGRGQHRADDHRIEAHSPQARGDVRFHHFQRRAAREGGRNGHGDAPVRGQFHPPHNPHFHERNHRNLRVGDFGEGVPDGCGGWGVHEGNYTVKTVNTVNTVDTVSPAYLVYPVYPVYLVYPIYPVYLVSLSPPAYNAAVYFQESDSFKHKGREGWHEDHEEYCDSMGIAAIPSLGHDTDDTEKPLKPVLFPCFP